MGTTILDVARAWADGKSRRGQRVFTHDGCLWSYGYHYMAARWVQDAGGRRVALLNSTKYSVSTSHHVSMAGAALRGSTVFFGVPDLGEIDRQPDHAANLASLLTDITEQLDKIRRGRGGAYWRLYYVRERVRNAQTYATMFGLPEPASPLVSTPELRQRLGVCATRVAFCDVPRLASLLFWIEVDYVCEQTVLWAERATRAALKGKGDLYV